MTAQETFMQLWGEVADLSAASEILGWDQETKMPKNGQGARAKVEATLARIHHSKLTSSEMTDALAAAMKKGDKMTVTFQSAQRKNISVPVTLRGFTAAYTKLKIAK